MAKKHVQQPAKFQIFRQALLLQQTINVNTIQFNVNDTNSVLQINHHSTNLQVVENNLMMTQCLISHITCLKFLHLKLQSLPHPKSILDPCFSSFSSEFLGS